MSSAILGTPCAQPPLQRRRTVLLVAAIWILIHAYLAVFRMLWPWAPLPLHIVAETAIFSVFVSTAVMLLLVPVLRRIVSGERHVRDITLLLFGSILCPALGSAAELIAVGLVEPKRLAWGITASLLTPFAATISAMGVVIASLLVLREEASARDLREIELSALLIRTQAEQLRARLPPPFLAAVLDDIAAQVDRDPRHADRMLLTFAAFLRSVLDVEREAVITVEAELDLVDQFAALAPGSVQLQFHADDDALDAQIPPLLIYTLVAMFVEESAVRIAVAVEIDRGMTVSVSAPVFFSEAKPPSCLDLLRRRLENPHGERGAMRVERTAVQTTVTLSLPGGWIA